jgi:DNA polymerase (family 10)
MDKWQAAHLLDEIARYTELSDPNRFKARAFERAARCVEALDRPIEQLVESGDLYQTPGIGKAIGPIITELVVTGSSRYLEDLRAQYPPGIFELMRVPGLGLRKIGVLHSQLGISTLDELEAACCSDRLVALRGFGAQTQKKILDGMELARRRESAFLLPTALDMADAIQEQIARAPGVQEAMVTGSVRRRLEVVHNVNVAIASRDPSRSLEAIGRANILDAYEIIGPFTARGALRGEMGLVLHAARPEDFGLLVLTTTGSASFVEAFLKRTAVARSSPRATEAPPPRRRKGPNRPQSEHEVFEAASILYIEPELRESAAPLARKRQPRLVSVDDLQGTFHVHTTWSDGRASVREMLGSARDRGFAYVGISDHSRSAAYAGGLTEERLQKQQTEIDAAAPEFAPLRVFKGTEADILADGAIDYGAETLAGLDFVIASVHSRFNMPHDEMTERMLKALSNPFVTFLGHITGRLLLSREGYSVDFDRLFDAAAKHGVLIELNGNPHRLDLDWRHIRNALDRGVRFSINPDAHSIREMGHVVSGTWVARKGGLSPEFIFNAQPLEAVEQYLANRRAAALRGMR